MIKLQATSINPTKRQAILKPLTTYRDKLFISTHAGHHIVLKTDINYVKADGNYCELHLKDVRKIVCSRTLKDVTRHLNPSYFIRIHQSYMVNLHTIVHVDAGFTQLTLADGTAIPISRSNRCALKSRMSEMFD